MLCPNCKTDENIRIHCLTPVSVYVDREGNVVDSSDCFDVYEWDDETAASCAGCDFDGAVADLIAADPEEEGQTPGKPPSEPEPVQIVLHVSDAEHSAILAALRFYQKHLTGELRTIYNTPHEKAYTLDVRDIATNGGAHEPLDTEDIDNLCERIN